VAVFATTVQVNPGPAGSPERPFYCNGGPLEPEVLERLKPYARTTDPCQQQFTRMRNWHFDHRPVTAIAADPSGQPINSPLFPDEFTALELALE
jgi:hypothetical protein